MFRSLVRLIREIIIKKRYAKENFNYDFCHHDGKFTTT